MEMPFGVWTRVGPDKHVLDGVRIGATWLIRLNRLCAAAMRLFRQITLTTCLLCAYGVPGSQQWLSAVSLWSPYGIGQTIIFLPCGFFFLSFFLA